jgi:protein-S-isoprenylcysteine O-methyltransferase Ste14
MVQLRGFNGPGRLITGGLFRKIRHPMYLGFCLWLVGYPLFVDATTALILVLPGLANVLLWRFYEDRMLGKTLAGYEAYQAGTWF